MVVVVVDSPNDERLVRRSTNEALAIRAHANGLKRALLFLGQKREAAGEESEDKSGDHTLLSSERGHIRKSFEHMLKTEILIDYRWQVQASHLQEQSVLGHKCQQTTESRCV